MIVSSKKLGPLNLWLGPQPRATGFLWQKVFAFFLWEDFFGGKFPTLLNKDLALCYNAIYNHTSARVSTKQGPTNPDPLLDPLLDQIWTPSG